MEPAQLRTGVPRRPPSTMAAVYNAGAAPPEQVFGTFTLGNPRSRRASQPEADGGCAWGRGSGALCSLASAGSSRHALYQVLVLRGLPPWAKEYDVYDFFQGHGVSPKSILILYRGETYVEVVGSSQARRAAEALQGCLLQGRPVAFGVCTFADMEAAAEGRNPRGKDRTMRTLGSPRAFEWRAPLVASAASICLREGSSHGRRESSPSY